MEFDVRALKLGGQLVELRLAAADRRALEREIRRQGLVLLAANERGAGRGAGLGFSIGRPRFPLTLFAQRPTHCSPRD